MKISCADGTEVVISDWVESSTYSTLYLPIELVAPTVAMAHLRQERDLMIEQANRLDDQIRLSRNRKHRRHHPDEQLVRRATRAARNALRWQAELLSAITETGRYREWTEEDKRLYEEKGLLPSDHDPNVLPEKGGDW